jgi:hypothetical protein
LPSHRRSSSKRLRRCFLDWLKAKHTLRRQQALDPVHVPYSLCYQRSALARQPPRILLLWTRRPQSSKSAAPRAPNSTMCAAASLRRSDRSSPVACGEPPQSGSINHMILYAVGCQQTVYQESVQSGLIHRHNLHGLDAAPLCLCLQATTQ